MRNSGGLPSRRSSSSRIPRATRRRFQPATSSCSARSMPFEWNPTRCGPASRQRALVSKCWTRSASAQAGPQGARNSRRGARPGAGSAPCRTRWRARNLRVAERGQRENRGRGPGPARAAGNGKRVRFAKGRRRRRVGTSPARRAVLVPRTDCGVGQWRHWSSCRPLSRRMSARVIVRGQTQPGRQGIAAARRHVHRLHGQSHVGALRTACVRRGVRLPRRRPVRQARPAGTRGVHCCFAAAPARLNHATRQRPRRNGAQAVQAGG